MMRDVHHSTLFYVLGPILIALGLVLIWAGTLGRGWNNTHNRAFRRVEHFSHRQSTYNNAANLIGGVVSVVAGIAILVWGPS